MEGESQELQGDASSKCALKKLGYLQVIFVLPKLMDNQLTGKNWA